MRLAGLIVVFVIVATWMVLTVNEVAGQPVRLANGLADRSRSSVESGTTAIKETPKITEGGNVVIYSPAVNVVREGFNPLWIIAGLLAGTLVVGILYGIKIYDRLDDAAANSAVLAKAIIYDQSNEAFLRLGGIEEAAVSLREVSDRLRDITAGATIDNSIIGKFDEMIESFNRMAEKLEGELTLNQQQPLTSTPPSGSRRKSKGGGDAGTSQPPH